MIDKPTKCALKLTAKTVGLRGIGLAVVGTAFIALAWGVGIIISTAEKYYPILHDIFSFFIIWLFAFMILFLIIFGIYKEYENNARLCRSIAEGKKKNG